MGIGPRHVNVALLIYQTEKGFLGLIYRHRVPRCPVICKKAPTSRDINYDASQRDVIESIHEGQLNYTRTVRVIPYTRSSIVAAGRVIDLLLHERVRYDRRRFAPGGLRGSCPR